MELNIQPFKEPRGFIRLLQWLFAICAFATTVDYSGKFGFFVICDGKAGNGTFQATGIAEYPFNLDHNVFSVDKALATECTDKYPKDGIQLVGNAQSESVFFVFTGVISFLYATVLIGVYAFADKIYMENRRILLGDFFITIILAVFWIAGASAWAHGVSSVSDAMDTTWLNCAKYDAALKCQGSFHDSTSKLVVSVLFGFINFVLWTGNIWFLYKETAGVLNGVGGGGQSSGP